MFLGCEIGGTKFQVGVCDRQGRVRALERRTVERKKGAAGILQQFTEVIPPLLKKYPVTAIGVGFGGPYDLERQRTVKSHQIDGWDGFPLQQWFRRQFGLPVVVENDQHCSAVAEATLGAGKGLRCVFYVTVGTGIGGGLVIDGKLHNGRYGAAEIGHTVLSSAGVPPVKPSAPQRHGRDARATWRTLEDLASGLAIERGVSTVPQAARYLGFAIANMIAIVNPDVVIVGGGVTKAGEKFFRPLRQTVKRLVFPVYANNYRIVPPQLAPTEVVVGAALLAARCSCASAKRGVRRSPNGASQKRRYTGREI